MKYSRLVINNMMDFKCAFILSIVVFFGLCTLGSDVEIKGTMVHQHVLVMV